MKYGIEVEGRLKGVPTLFMDHTEVGKYAHGVEIQVSHIYVSDHGTQLDIQWLSQMYPHHFITWEVRKVPELTQYPKNVSIMLRDPTFEQVSKLRPGDQVKFEQNQNVIVFPMEAAITTRPEDFKDDVIL